MRQQPRIELSCVDFWLLLPIQAGYQACSRRVLGNQWNGKPGGRASSTRRRSHNHEHLGQIIRTAGNSSSSAFARSIWGSETARCDRRPGLEVQGMHQVWSIEFAAERYPSVWDCIGVFQMSCSFGASARRRTGGRILSAKERRAIPWLPKLFTSAPEVPILPQDQLRYRLPGQWICS